MQKIVFAGLVAILCLFGLNGWSQSKSRINTIIVDAGHGGAEPGAKGTYSTEAEITLALALKVGTLLENELRETRILQTRTNNITQSVREKANFANENKGDLFVCIHVNAAPPIRHSQVVSYRTRTYYTGKGKKRRKHTKKEPVYKVWYTPNPRYGTGTYVWAADRMAPKSTAIVERFVSESEADVPDPNTPEGLISSRLWAQRFFTNSIRLGTLIENEFVKLGRKSDGVLQRNEKGIWVLQATNMPAVLIETGFITNKDEEDYLNSDEGQNEMAAAIVKGVIRFKSLLDGSRSNTAVDSSVNTSKQVPVTPEPENRKPLAVMPKKEE